MLVPRIVGLIRSIRDPETHAVGEWSVGDVAVHLGKVRGRQTLGVKLPGVCVRQPGRRNEPRPSHAPVSRQTADLVRRRGLAGFASMSSQIDRIAEPFPRGD